MSFEETKFYLGLLFQALNAAATAGVWLYVRYGNRNEQIDKRFTAIQEDYDRRADEHDRRLSRLEVQVSHAPTHDDLSKLHEKLNVTAQGVSQMAGELKGMNETLRLILTRIAEKGMP
jgi:alkanesulfonate monooxygenase SsuD/methylene tetrahydromethanopterin reductase-like flavin-dependent oxidoreductase (luciferase family)